jgi:hypothetical protein
VSGALRRVAGIEPSTVDRHITEHPGEFPAAPGPAGAARAETGEPGQWGG